MSRTKGSKDKKPRHLSEASLANLGVNTTPGFRSASVRIYAPSNDVRWFTGMEPRERGEIVTKARRMTDET